MPHKSLCNSGCFIFFFFAFFYQSFGVKLTDKQQNLSFPGCCNQLAIRRGGKVIYIFSENNSFLSLHVAEKMLW